MEPDLEIFFDLIEFVNSFCYLGDRLNFNGTRIEWKNLENIGNCFKEQSFR